MVAVPNCGDMRSPCSPEGRRRRMVVSHRLPLRAVPNPDAPFRFDLSLDRAALPFKHSRCLPGDVVYVGALPAAAASIPASEELAAHLLERFSCIPVFIEEDLHKDYYHEFCMRGFHGETLRRRGFHGVCGADFNAEQYGAYISANTRFAERVLELLVSPDEDLVYIHDYHLLTLPSIIRKRSPCTRIYFTLHSAIPCTDAFCSSPIAKELLCNLLNADLLAFASSWSSSWYHPSSYGYQGFLSSCSRLLNLSYKYRQGYSIMDYLDHRTVVVKSTSTSSGKMCHLREMMYLPETTAKLREISTMYMDRKLLLDVEEDDYLYWERCNLPESQTELCCQVVLVMIITRHHISANVMAIRDRINSCFGFQGYEPVVVIDDPSMHELLAFYTLADVFIAKTSSTKKFIHYTLHRQEGQVAHRPARAPRNGTIIATGRYPLWEPCLWLPNGAIWVNWHHDASMAMADAMSSVCEKQLRHEKHYRYVRTHDVGYWARCFQEDLERACRYHHQSAMRCWATSFGVQVRPVLLDSIYNDMVSPQELKTLATMLGVIRLTKRKVSIILGFFSLLTFDKRILLMNNDSEYHRAGMYRSILQDYIDMVPLQALVKTSALEVIRILQVMSSDPNNTTSSVSGRRKNKPAIWLALALYKLMSADHGYSTSSQRKNSTFSARIPSYLTQLVAACNSSASAEQSGVAQLHPSRRPLIRFLLDSGASMHVVGDAGLLHNLRRLPRAAARFATLPDGSRLPIIGIGTIQMDNFTIPDVHLVEGVTVNLVSVSRLAMDHNICCCFYRNRCQLMLLADGTLVGEAILEDDGVYGLRFLRIPEATA